MKRICLFSALISSLFIWSCGTSTSLQTQATEPVWVNYENRNKTFPSNVYLKGYSLSNKLEWEKLDDFLERVATIARKELLESIQVAVKNESILSVKESTNYGHSNVSSNYKINATSESKFDIANIVTDKFYNEKTKTGYALAYVKRGDVIQFYASIINSNLLKIENGIQESNRYFSQKQFQKSIQTAARALIFFNEMDGAKNILNALKVNEEAYTNEQRIIKDLAELNDLISKASNEQQIILTSKSLVYFGEYGEPLDKEIQLQANFSSRINNEVPSNLPIQLVQDSIVFCKANTDENGNASCVIKKIRDKNNLQYINAKVDLENYLNVNKRITELPIFKNLFTPLQFTIHVEKVKISIQANEKNANGTKANDFLEPQLKSFLSDNAFVFVLENQSPHYKIILETKPTQSNNGTDLMFVYQNTTVTIIDVKKQMEVYKSGFNNIKGVAIDPLRALALANKKTFELIADDLKKWLNDR